MYLVTEKWTETDIGLILSIGSLATLVSQIPCGALIDAVRSERTVAGVAIVAIAVSALTIAAWPLFLAVALARVVQAVGSALLGPAVAALSLGLVGPVQLASRLARNARFASAGNGIAALIMGAIGHFLSAKAVFVVTAFFAFPALFAILQISDRDVNPVNAHGGITEPPRAGLLPGLRVLFRKRALWIFVTVIVLFQAANAPLLQLAAAELTTQASSWAITLIAACIVLPQIIVMLLSPLVGRLAESIGRRPLLLLALGALPIRAVLFALLSQPIPIVAIQLLDGLSAAVLNVLIPLVIADITFGTGRFNLAQGAVGTAVGLAAAAGMASSGYIADEFGPSAAFFGLAAAAAVGFAVVALLMPETRSADE